MVNNDRTEAQLDRLVNACRKIVARGAQRDWDLGVLLVRIFNKELWTLRRDEFGEQRYKRFWHFCWRELGISPPTATRCMRIAQTFKRKSLEGVTSMVANKLGNVKDEKIRSSLLRGSATSFTWITHQLDKLPDTAFKNKPLKQNRIRYGTVSAVGHFLRRSHGRLVLMIRNGKFVVTYTTKNGITRIGQDEIIQDAVEQALKSDAHRTRVDKRVAA